MCRAGSRTCGQRLYREDRNLYGGCRCRGKEKSIKKINPPLIIVLGFAGIALLGAFLLSQPFSSNSQTPTSFIDSLFVATSALCVTGLSPLETATHWNIIGQSIILLLIQIGGLGFMSFGVLFALLLSRRITLKERMLLKEAFQQENIAGLVHLGKKILLFTFAFELFGAFLLSLRLIPLYGRKGIWMSLFHAVSAFCNAGFDILGNGDSMAMFARDTYVSAVLSMLVIAGGLGFVVLFHLLHVKKKRKLTLQTKAVLLATFVLLTVGTLLFFLLEYDNETMSSFTIGEKLNVSFFQSMTCRTAGFSSIDFGKMRQATLLISMVLMFIGGAGGSTAGGIKVGTLFVVLATVRSVLLAREETTVMKRQISDRTVHRALTIVTISVAVVLLGTILLSFSEAHPLIDLMFETVSAFSTTGISTGITASLSVFGKAVVIGMMFFGRVGILTIMSSLASFVPQKKKFRYPQEDIAVG